MSCRDVNHLVEEKRISSPNVDARSLGIPNGPATEVGGQQVLEQVAMKPVTSRQALHLFTICIKLK